MLPNLLQIVNLPIHLFETNALRVSNEGKYLGFRGDADLVVEGFGFRYL